MQMLDNSHRYAPTRRRLFSNFRDYKAVGPVRHATFLVAVMSLPAMAQRKTIIITLIATPMACLLWSCAASKPLITRAADEELATPALGVLHHNFKMKDLVGDELGAAGVLANTRPAMKAPIASDTPSSAETPATSRAKPTNSTTNSSSSGDDRLRRLTNGQRAADLPDALTHGLLRRRRLKAPAASAAATRTGRRQKHEAHRFVEPLIGKGRADKF